MQSYCYKTISAQGAAEFKDRGSRFLAFAFPVNSTEEVKEKIAFLKEEHPKAVHHCYAFRIGTDGNQFRASDDGEPSGSAGRPILGQIDSAGITNVLIVVVRYFGGTLLGVPGLINAYKTAAADVLKNIPVVEKWLEQKLEFTCDYHTLGSLLHLLKQAESTIYEQELQLFCLIRASVPIPLVEQVLSRVSEIRGVTVRQIN